VGVITYTISIKRKAESLALPFFVVVNKEALGNVYGKEVSVYSKLAVLLLICLIFAIKLY
jgi:ribosomal protein L7Ae-like RNA K-turn-binding protein